MKVRKVLLMCGIISSLLWISTDIIAAIQYDGYSYINQSISELSANGAPTRAFLTTTGIIYELLLFAFGLGVLEASNPYHYTFYHRVRGLCKRKAFPNLLYLYNPDTFAVWGFDRYGCTTSCCGIACTMAGNMILRMYS